MMKKVYIKPKLDTYGSIEQLTLNGRNRFSRNRGKRFGASDGFTTTGLVNNSQVPRPPFFS